MPRMIDLIRVSALPSNVMMAAARGSLSVPPREMIEILVYLAEHNKIFGEQAKLTLAGWDEAASKTVAGDASTPKEVLDYMISPRNLRPLLLPALLENPAVGEERIAELAAQGPRDVVGILRNSERVKKSAKIQESLKCNAHMLGAHPEGVINDAPTIVLQMDVPSPSSELPIAEVPLSAGQEDFLVETASAPDGPEEVLDEGILAYLNEHSAEIENEGDKPFQPIGGFNDEFIPSDEPLADATSQHTATAAAAAPKRAQTGKKAQVSHEDERGSALKKISLLGIKGRIQLAMKGTKEDRSILIRDGTKIVALAVLESPKITDGEVESFASQKNVLEAVLRGIPMKRRFAKNYVILRNLTFNPRTPLDVSLALIKHLLVKDLRNLSGNKEVSETVRKLALKMFKQKMETGAKS
jgi:hypothetical protein